MILITGVFLFVLSAVLSAQTQALRGFLLEQPRYNASMEFLPANRIANYSAAYRVGEDTLRVYVAAPQEAVSGFVAGGCGFAPTEQRADLIRFVGVEYDIYVIASPELPWTCAFLEQFEADFAFFAQLDRATTEAIRRLSTEIPTRLPSEKMQFPAVLDLGSF